MKVLFFFKSGDLLLLKSGEFKFANYTVSQCPIPVAKKPVPLRQPKTTQSYFNIIGSYSTAAKMAYPAVSAVL